MTKEKAEDLLEWHSLSPVVISKSGVKLGCAEVDGIITLPAHDEVCEALRFVADYLEGK